MVISRRRIRFCRRAGVGLLGLVGLGLLLSGCGGPDIAAFESLKAHPMASPTLSFASPTRISGTAGSSAGIQSPSRITTQFDIDEPQMEQAVAEFLAQALAAGFELEMVDTFGDPTITYRSVGNGAPSLNFGAGVDDDGQASAGVTLRQ